ncbi:MAG TPA: cupin domain-containing protein [Solirubrobacteraceae bacterium]|jgi:mannose-6-phosphate isomerase-like protein (cupin superfamily)
MAHEGQELVGHNGFRLKLIQITDDLLVMEGSYSGEGKLPPEHFHPKQDEHFEVREGAVRAVIDGHERRYVAGDAFDVPAGTPHQMAGDGAARLHWEVRPALKMAEFFERAYSDDPGADFLEAFADEFRLTGRTGA